MGDRICVMKEGHIMQVADPVTLYNRPENVFVAGFIGTPEMNLVPAELDARAKPVVRIGDQSVEFGDGLAQRLQAKDVRDVTFGIRPQHLRLAGPKDKSALNGTISHVEFMGHEVYLYVDVEKHRFILVLPSEKYDAASKSGDRISFVPNEGSVHLFDKEDGRNISLSLRPPPQPTQSGRTIMKKTLTALATIMALTATASAADLRMSWWGGDSRHTATQEALKVCGAKYGHTIQPEFTGWQGHAEKFTTQLAGGTEADIMQINWPWLFRFSQGWRRLCRPASIFATSST